jgi:hypothetical protein
MKLKPLIVFFLIRVISLTYRYKYLNPEVLENTKKDCGNYIFSIWHQNLIGAIFSQIGTPHAVIVSPSNDGELVANTCEKMGHVVARGSSSRGGQSALKKMIRLLKTYPGAITVDGPQGPAKIPKKGVFELAYLTDLKIIPFTIIPKSYWSIKKSWDNFRIPKPFTTFYIHFGAPLKVDKGYKTDNFHQASIDLKQQMEQSEAYINSILDAV